MAKEAVRPLPGYAEPGSTLACNTKSRTGKTVEIMGPRPLSLQAS